MHLPDGFVSLPVNITSFAASGALFLYSIREANKKLELKQVPLLAVSAAFIFAAQMLNFPVLPGVSGHFMGAVLAMILLGPFNSFIVMTLVLVLQALMFADGGVLALGSNIFNMGFMGAIVSYFVFAGLLRILPKTKPAFLANTFFVSWLSIVLASASCSAMLAISGTYPFVPTIVSMTGVHAIIGIGEAIITTTVISLVVALRPDLVALWHGGKA